MNPMRCESPLGAVLCREATRRIASGDREGASRIVDSLLRAWPNDPYVLVVAGNFALSAGLDGVAIDLYERSLVLVPDYGETLTNLGFVYRRQHRLGDARSVLLHLLGVDPTNIQGWINYTATFVNEGEPTEGESAAREALRYHPGSAELHWNLALVLLEQGRWSEGWTEYRYRFAAPSLRGGVGRLPSGVPRLPAPESLRAGQTVVCRGEQGLGDEILFAGMLRQFIDDAASRGAVVRISGNRRLETVYRRCFPECEWAVAPLAKQADWIVPIGDLPGYYRTADTMFPWRSAYLRPDPESSATLRRHLLDLARGKPIVGVAPSGGIQWTHDVFRTVGPSEWRSLFSVPALFVGLGYRGGDEALAALAANVGADFRYFPQIVQDADYGRTFDLVAALDLVITVPTSVLHVAGALGIPCWVAMSHRAAWRECSHDATIPWYPVTHERFVRDASEKDWHAVIGRIAGRLADRGVTVSMTSDLGRKHRSD